VLLVPNVSRPSEEEFERRWSELASQLAGEFGSPEATDRAPESAGAEIESARAEIESDDEGWGPPAGGGPELPPGPRDWAEPAEEEHFIPPDPGPVTEGADPLLVMAWVGLGIGLIGLAAFYVLHMRWDPLIPKALVALVAGCVAAMVWRMPHRRDPDDPDTGARV
jgi:hypothetical protein